MKEAFELIIERLKLPQGVAKRCLDYKVAKAYGNAIKIVNQVAEECKDRIFINGQCCWQSCACTEKCQECNRYTLSNSDIDWYESIEDWNDEYGKDTNVRSTNQSFEKIMDILCEFQNELICYVGDTNPYIVDRFDEVLGKAIQVEEEYNKEHNKEYNKEYNTDAPDINVRTNADHIRNLTDEELANTLLYFDFCDICSPCWDADDCVCTNEEVKEKVVKWLQEPKGEK